VNLQLGKGKDSSMSATTDADGCYRFDVATSGQERHADDPASNLP
jgi:hypothetical protein